MKVVIDIPNDFTGDYIVDKFKDFFSRVIADIDCKGMCGRYEKEIAEMFLKVFDDSEEKISCNCHHNSNSRDSKQTNADRIRNMSDEELLDFICSIETYDEGSVKTIENGSAMCSVTDVEKWLQSEAE